MSIITDKKYIMLLSGKLERFRQKGPDLFVFRCPLCGDSKKDKTKTRGYIYRKKDNMFFHCHNCNESDFFGKFLKRIDPSLHRSYSFDNFTPKPKTVVTEAAEDYVTNPREKLPNVDLDIPTVGSLPHDHFAKQFLIKRKIPENRFGDILYTTCFRTTVEKIRPEYAEEKGFIYGEKRLVLPFYDKKNKLLGFQGRALSESKAKYITILVSEDSKKVYGLNSVDLSKTVYVTEGPFDSMFLDNAIASMDSALYKIVEIAGPADYVFIYDNEKRNNQITKAMSQTIDMGHKIFIWPKSIQEKDINDYILAGHDNADLRDLINKRTYEGLKAKLMFTEWRK